MNRNDRLGEIRDAIGSTGLGDPAVRWLAEKVIDIIDAIREEPSESSEVVRLKAALAEAIEKMARKSEVIEKGQELIGLLTAERDALKAERDTTQRQAYQSGFDLATSERQRDAAIADADALRARIEEADEAWREPGTVKACSIRLGQYTEHVRLVPDPLPEVKP